MNRKQNLFALTTTINNRTHYVFKHSVPAENYTKRIVRYTEDIADAMTFKSANGAQRFAAVIKNPFEYQFTPEALEEDQVPDTSKTNTPEEAVHAL